MAENWRHLLELTGQHLQISLVAVLAALVVGGALGVLANRYRRIAEPLIGLVSVFQTIPALAFIGFVMLFLGLTRTTGMTVLFFYALLPIVRGTYTGLTQVSPGILESARGMGMTRWQILTRVQLPLALPVILVGLRLATVIAVGTASIMSLAGAGGLGQEIFAGIDRVQDKMILAGALPAAILAALADRAISALERLATPAGVAAPSGGAKASRGRQWITVGAFVAVSAVSMVAAGGAGPRAGVVTIGSKDFTESILLGEIAAQTIEATTDIKVVRKLNLGGTKVTFDGLRSGSLDMYVEYDGTGYSIHLGHTEPITDPSTLFGQVKREFEERFDLTWSEPFGFNNTFALAMPEALVKQYGIRTGSDLVPYSPQFTFGTTNEFMGRTVDGYAPLVEAYGYKFAAVRTMTAGLRYKAVQQNEIQVMDAYSTDGKLKEFNMVTLEDDKGFFPPYNGAMVMRMDTLEKNPGLLEAINQLAGTMSDEVVRELNYRVEVLGESVQVVAADFLRAQGIVQ